MIFFSVKIKNNILKFHINYIYKVSFAILLLLLLSSFFVNIEKDSSDLIISAEEAGIENDIVVPGDKSEITIFGEIFFYTMIAISFLGLVYIEQLIFDKNDETITIKRGLFFLYKKKTFGFKDFNGITIKKIPVRGSKILRNNLFSSGDVSERVKYYFAFSVGNKYFILDKSMSGKDYIENSTIFKSFWPGEIKESM